MRGRSRHSAIFLAVVVAAVAPALLLSACGSTEPTPSSTGGSAAAAGAPQKGGQMLVSYMGEPQYLDPAADWEGNGWSIEHCIYNTLLTYASASGDKGTVLVPDMATEVPTVDNGGITNDGKTYTFHLHKGIKFAPPVDREVTSADVKYSIERMMAPDTKPVPPATSFYMSIEGAPAFNAGKAKSMSGIVTPDDYTVVINLSKPDATILYSLTMSFCDVVPKEWVEKQGKQFVRNPLGTGPYMVDHWSAGAEMVLVRNPNYWDWRGHKDAWVDGIKFTFGLNPQTALLKLKAGENDVLGDYIPPSDYVSVTNDPVWSKQVADAPAIAIDYLFMNVTVKPFDDPKVREAVAWSIDRDKIIKLISGAGSRLDQIYPAGLPGYVEGPDGVFGGYDVGKAKQLLAEAGYPDGFETTLYSHNVDPWPKVIQSIQYDLQQIGVKAQVKLMNRSTYWTYISMPGKTPIGLQDLWQDFPDPSDFLVAGFSKSNAVPNGLNPSYWWSPQVEKQLAQSFAMTDQQARLDLFDQMQRETMAEWPAVPLYQPNVNSVFSKRTHGWYLHPVWIFDFLDYWLTSK
jgi:peptide/nickel transport system substrate-binding protein/oligopeptide transport system substrate-binding protein